MASRYRSPSQKARVITEEWVKSNAFCPNCGNSCVNKFPNNTPVADFYCERCNEEFELKSSQSRRVRKVVDGAYDTMIRRLQENNNPNFFFLHYDKLDFKVRNFFVIPKHFFIPNIIERRPALRSRAKRAGWVGCNILIENLPQSGKIFIVRDNNPVPQNEVLVSWQRTAFLGEEESTTSKGWLLDIMKCIESINRPSFSLDDIYAFEQRLQQLYPKNHHIKAKIRQQLQILRDKQYLNFTNRGTYTLL